MNSDKILLEEIYEAILLNEVDWERFKDVKKECLTADAVAEKLNNELERLKVPSSKRPKAAFGFAKISKGNIPLQQGRVDVEQFIKNLTQLPKTIFDVGEKSEHSEDEKSMTINTGIPALRAVMWDEENESFYVINTCPGAGECAKICYALKGFYIINDGKNMKLLRRLQFMMNHPDEYARIAYNEAEIYAIKARQANKKLNIRWNDAGDLFSEEYFKIMVDVTNKLKEKYNVQSYAYTKIAKYVELGMQNGIIMNFSSGAKSSEKEQADLEKSKYSKIVDRDIFKGVFVPAQSGYKKDESGKTRFKDAENGREQLKQIIYDAYKNNQEPDIKDLTYDSLRYTDELPAEEADDFIYNLIVLPQGDSDKPAQRRDVRYTFLLQH